MSSAQRIIYIPGMGLNGAEFARTAQLLEQAGYECVLARRPGTNWDEPFDAAGAQAKVRELITPGCAIVAHSLGGFLVPPDERIGAIIYLDASLPDEAPFPLLNPLIRAAWPLLRHLGSWEWVAEDTHLARALQAAYEHEGIERLRELANSQTDRAPITVITAGSGSWLKAQAKWAKEIGATHRWIDGPHLLAAARPLAVAAQIQAAVIDSTPVKQ